MFAYNVEIGKCDGLFVTISGHGYDSNIITSDYGLINKNLCHRIFSQYVVSREVPRVFLYDCCDGSETMHGAPITVGKFIENKQEIVEEKEKSEISGNRQQISVEMVEMIDIPCKRREIE
eukprot:368472_1